MSSDMVVRVEQLGKCYHIYERPRDRLIQMVRPGRRKYYREFWALRNVSFEVGKGETVGIIGRNGSGKSTLLQLICGTLSPTCGTITTRGRLAALLELGSGFNPEFSGRENVYLNGGLLGLTRDEIDARFDEIVAFSEIASFIDQPTKTYSSGMAVRLAFSVAIHTSPEVLVVDEALAVGDFQFQSKCYKRIKSIKERGATILLVSHDLSAISQFCDRAILMSDGEVHSLGSTAGVINDFKRLCTTDQRIANQEESLKLASGVARRKFCESYLTDALHRSGEGQVSIVDWLICGENDDQPVSTLQFNSQYTITVVLKANIDGVNPNVGFFFTDSKGNEIAGSALHHEGRFTGMLRKGNVISIRFTFKVIIRPGRYYLNLGCSEYVGGNLKAYDRLYSATEVVVAGQKDLVGYAYLSPSVEIGGWAEGE